MKNSLKKESNLIHKLSQTTFEFSSKDKEDLIKLKEKIDMALQLIDLQEQTANLQNKIFYMNFYQNIRDNSVITWNNQEINIEDLSIKLSSIHKQIIKLIGKDGVSSSTDLIDLVSKTTDVSESNVRHSLKKLVEEYYILNEYDGSTALFPRRFMYSFNALGKALYQYIYETLPVSSEVEELLRMNISIPKALFTKDIAAILSNQSRYNSVNIQLLNPESSFDIITKDQSGEAECWIVYHQKKTSKDFTKLLSKVRQESYFLNIVVENKSMWNQVKEMIESYIMESRYGKDAKSSKSNSKLTIYLGTAGQLQNETMFSNINCKFVVR